MSEYEPHILPVGNRRDDPPRKHWRWRAGLVIQKYPVQVAILAALVVLALPVAMLVSANSDLRTSQGALRDALVTGSTSRQATSREICKAINDNARTNNGQNRYLKAIILESVKQSQRFQPTYDRLGLPSYGERLKQAKAIAKSLDQFNVKPLGCAALQRRIEREILSAQRKGIG